MQNYQPSFPCHSNVVTPVIETPRVFLKGVEIKWGELAYLLDIARAQVYSKSDHDTVWNSVATKYIELFDSIGDGDGK